MDWQAGSVDTNGITLRYHRAGQGDPLVMLHGIMDSGLCWARTADHLAARYDVILLDARGHGESDKPASGYTAPDHAADVAGAIQALGLERVILVGHSMGAEVAAVVAAHYPALVRALALEDPPWFVEDETPEFLAGQEQMFRELYGYFHGKSLEQLLTDPGETESTWHPSEIPAWAKAKHQYDPEVMQYIRTDRHNWTAVQGKITCPLLLISGDPELGALVTPEVSAEIARWPQAQAVRLGGAGHSIRRDQYAAYIAALDGFLAGV